ncbi:MAG: ABC-type transporter, periplasmic subunit [Frankiales bacterium]|nr:ABC-type transporter, periplasmic subunit [Frankiales bacterium]
MTAACANDPASSGASGESGGGGGRLTIAMTAANLPGTDTPPTEGGEGFRFVGYQLYDPLVSWDLADESKLATLAPGLAESWKVDPADQVTWTLELRHGVTFHDGTPWNADAAVFAFDRVMDPAFEFYSKESAAASASYVSYIADVTKVDDDTIAIRTKTPNSLLPYALTSVLFPSPTAVKERGNQAYADAPVGTGPFKFGSRVERQSLLLQRNPDYWGGAAKVAELELLPVPEPSARLAALLSGSVDWAEVPPPDGLEQLKKADFTVHQNFIPFVWPWVLDVSKKPFNDVRVRQALNLAIDKDAMIKNILAGTASPATGPVYEGHPWYPEDAPKYSYDPARARALLAEAGYPNGLSMKVMAPTSGSGNMLPLPMNEFVQQQLAAIGVKVDLELIEWNTMRSTYRAGFPAGTDALQYAWTVSTPDWLTRFYASTSTPPAGLNPGKYANPKVDALLAQAQRTFDEKERDAVLKQAMSLIQSDAPWVFVVHDLNSRATAKGVSGLVMAQSSYVDLTTVSVDE